MALRSGIVVTIVWASAVALSAFQSVGKDRQYDRRSLHMCSHHLVKLIACTRA
jgi:hypothetical protein